MSAAYRQPPKPEPDADRAASRAEVAALRAALLSETRIAEALAQRSRSLVGLVETLARRTLQEAHDIADAERRLDGLSVRVRAALDAGEARAASDLRMLATRTLAAFETDCGPRIASDGPSIEISADAARLVGLTLFELASRSARFGALATPEGRVVVGWTRRPDGALRLSWREYGGATETCRRRAGAGGALLDLLVARFGAPLRVRVHPFGLSAELLVPAADLAGDRPQRLRAVDANGSGEEARSA